MKQLVQLQNQKAAFDTLNAELICVLREEKKQVEGLKKAFNKTKFSTLLVDTPTTHTKDYSKQLFATYFIDKQGTVKAVLTGTKAKRPSTDDILTQAKQSFSN